MPLLTSDSPSPYLSAVLVLSDRLADLPGYCAVTFLPHTRRIYAHTLRVTLGFASSCLLAQGIHASYALHVLRAGSLLSASSGHCLAALPLRFC